MNEERVILISTAGNFIFRLEPETENFYSSIHFMEFDCFTCAFVRDFLVCRGNEDYILRP